MDVAVGRVSSGGSNKGDVAAPADASAALKDWLVAARAAVSADDLRRNSRRECGCNQVRGSGVTVGQCRASGQKASSSRTRFGSKGAALRLRPASARRRRETAPWRLTRTSCRLSVSTRPETHVIFTTNISRLGSCADTVCQQTLHRRSSKPAPRRSFT